MFHYHDNILDSAYDDRNSSLNAIYSTTSNFDKVVNETENGVPVLFTMINHSTVAAGYRLYGVRYEKTTGILWWKITETMNDYSIRKVVVNDGNSNARQYSYFPAGLIPSSLTSILYN